MIAALGCELRGAAAVRALYEANRAALTSENAHEYCGTLITMVVPIKPMSGENRMSIAQYDAPADFRPGQALIFGGSGGLGIAIAQAIAARGCPVVLSYQNGRATAEAAAEAIRRVGGQAVARQAMIEDMDSVQAFVTAAVADGPIHTVVSASGPHIHLEPLSKSRIDRLRDYVQADIIGFATIAQAVIPHLRRNRGSITALITCAAERWLPHDILSVVPKAGVGGLQLKKGIKVSVPTPWGWASSTRA